MSDEQAFLAALAADPADDTSRLVYADWLDERSEATKAEYLRLVVGLIPHFETGKDDPPESCRVLALSETLPPEWRLAAAARFGAVLYGVHPGRRMEAIRFVREQSVFMLEQAHRFLELETLPYQLPVRTTLEGAIGIRNRFLKHGLDVAAHPSALPKHPTLAAYKISAAVISCDLSGDSDREALGVFRDFIASALAIPADQAAALAQPDTWVTLVSSVETTQIESHLDELRSLIPHHPEDRVWEIVLTSDFQFGLFPTQF